MLKRFALTAAARCGMGVFLRRALGGADFLPLLFGGATALGGPVLMVS